MIETIKERQSRNKIKEEKCPLIKKACGDYIIYSGMYCVNKNTIDTKNSFINCPVFNYSMREDIN